MNVEICKDLTFDDGLHVYKLHGVTLPSVTQLIKPLTDDYYGDIDYEFLKNAATRGTTIHNSIENYWLFNVVDIPHEYKAYMDAFLKFVEMYKPKPLATEVRFYHKYLYYAGTADLICTLNGNNNEVWLIDYKATAGIHKFLTRIQLEGYKQGIESQGITIHRKGILHLTKTGKFTLDDEYDDEHDSESLEVFSALLTLYNYMKKNKK